MEAEPLPFSSAAAHAGDSPRLVEAPLILLIEDDFMLRTTLAEVLRAQGYRVECYANGLDALKRLEAPPMPSLILLDIMLPYMDGVQFREQQMASDARGVPVVVITAVGVPRDKAGALRFTRTFHKPLDMPQLLGAIRQLCPFSAH
jgi:two-component system, chemotaxis family, chemotaxis protein CheY